MRIDLDTAGRGAGQQPQLLHKCRSGRVEPSAWLPDSYGSGPGTSAEARLRACRILAATVFLAEAARAHVAKRVKL
jgi:hypothetical protein